LLLFLLGVLASWRSLLVSRLFFSSLTTTTGREPGTCNARNATVRLNTLAGPAGVLLVLAAGCSQTRVVRVARPAPVAPVTIVTTQPQAATVAAPPPAPPSPPPVVNYIVEPQAPSVGGSPPAYGVTEAQPDAPAHAQQTVALASQQIDRLQRIQRSESNAAPREDVEQALADLEGKRDTVLQDLRELAIQPTGDVLSKLSADDARLLGAVRVSYVIARPPAQGLPQPSPLPPAQVP
jgi:hypothetical protein